MCGRSRNISGGPEDDGPPNSKIAVMDCYSVQERKKLPYFLAAEVSSLMENI